ncbi:hypothetical protein EJB05_28269, partial [Eragrostis curvula]
MELNCFEMSASFHYPHLVIFDEHEIDYVEAKILGLVVVLKTHSPFLIDNQLIQSALHEQTGVLLPLNHISQYLCDYVLITGDPKLITRILRHPFLKLDQRYLSMLPLTLNYGSIEVEINDTVPRSQTQSYSGPQNVENRQSLLLVVAGLPPVFWHQTHLIPTIFRNICVVKNIRVNPADLAFSMETYACPSTIPPVMQIGIRKRSTTMDIWNIWIRVRPFPPTDAHAAQANDTIPRLCYNLFLLEDEDGEGTSEVGGALGPSHQQAGMLQPVYTSPLNYKLEHLDSPTTALPYADPHASGYYIEAPVSSSDDSMHIPDTPINEGSTEVPETPSNEGDTEIILASSSPARNEAISSCPF